MSFTAGWLDLREPADLAARDPGLLALAAGWLAPHPAPLVLDIGAGTGSTARALALPAATRWRLVDRDPTLLAVAARRLPGAEALLADLTDLDALPFQGTRLVTASALLDLAGADWLDGLADRVAEAGAALYATLSYDGTLAFTPPLPDDDPIAAAFNDHQRRDKGLGGPALGPAAAARLADTLTRRGYLVRLAPSPWRLRPGPLLDALLDGIAAAAAETGHPSGPWRQARAATAAAVVGHLDLFACPAGTSAQSNTTSLSSP